MQKLTALVSLAAVVVSVSCKGNGQSRGLTELTRDVTWCVAPAADYRLARQCGPDLFEYVRPSDSHTYLGTPVLAIGYFFTKSELRFIRIYVDPAQYEALRRAANLAFGPSTVPEDPEPNWFSSDDRTLAVLSAATSKNPQAFLELSYVPAQKHAPEP